MLGLEEDGMARINSMQVDSSASRNEALELTDNNKL